MKPTQHPPHTAVSPYSQGGLQVLDDELGVEEEEEERG
jgi:hypothetical protein